MPMFLTRQIGQPWWKACLGLTWEQSWLQWQAVLHRAGKAVEGPLSLLLEDHGCCAGVHMYDDPADEPRAMQC